jgi:quinol monooxygenase YgiN
MSTLDISARVHIRDGKLDDFKRQAAECTRLTREKDTKTLRYDLFLNEDQTYCEWSSLLRGLDSG